MLHDLKHRLYWDMINVWNEGLLPSVSDITCGQVTVERSGTPVQMSASSVPLRGGVFIRKVASDGTLGFVGSSDDVDTSSGFLVSLNNPAWIEVSDLSSLWVDSDGNDTKWSLMAF